MASGLITSWQIDGEKTETVTDFIFLSSKITTDGNYIQKLKLIKLINFFLERKAMTNLTAYQKAETSLCLNHHNQGSHSPSYGFSSNHVWM